MQAATSRAGLAEGRVPFMPIDEIRIENRHRRDLGSIDELRDSIAAVGLLHPVVVTPGGRLVAGERRIAACLQLGWVEIAATIVESLADARAALRAEQDENVCRKDMTPAEKVSLGRELEKLERPGAAERKASTQAKSKNRSTGEGNFPSPNSHISGVSRGERTGKVYDLVGEMVDMSGPTYKRAKAVVDAAASDEPGAREALEHMEATGKVTPAYNELKAAKAAAQLDRSDMTERQKQIAAASKLRIEKAIGTCNGIARGLASLKVPEAARVSSVDEIEGWDSAICDAIAALKLLRKRLKELT